MSMIEEEKSDRAPRLHQGPDHSAPYPVSRLAPAFHNPDLYRKPDGRAFFSMLSPTHWGGRPPHGFVGSYRLESDWSWTPAEAAAGPDDTADLVNQLLRDGGLMAGGSS
ncbi:DUF2452 domain-containing protein [uncultured Thiodictyon sp.]|jgi:hypothetical protein|uniref:DUF2452 domain-containing protein n=1 Tax=uncultured Thiodictyon sp. TaxID=1846217 RepID=UPI0025D73A6B|nr:DUF2452 domain-containing protein [uncultured Thiodictyon sp.]